MRPARAVQPENMTDQKTERSNCRFAVQLTSDGKPLLVMELYQDTIPALKGMSIGFDLLGGTSLDMAKRIAEGLNEHILDLFVTTEKTT
jgi:hypothetical protein